MMNRSGLPGVSHINLLQEQTKTHKLEKMALTLLCVGVASTLLMAFSTLTALAAQPGAPSTPTNTRVAPPALLVAAPLAKPGTLTGLTAGPTVNIGTALVFNFAGTGHCKLSLNSGDGIVTEFNGELSFKMPYTYSGASMSSSETYQDYTASVTPFGDCKTNGLGPFTTIVRVVNPHPQGASAPPKDSAVVLAGNGMLSKPIKPGAVDIPSVPATIASVTFSGKAVTGAPSAAPGSATVLTVNGTGFCKYHLSYVNLDSQGNTIMKPYPMIPLSSTPQNHFPMTITALAATPAGIYKWIASAVDGCVGTKDVTFTVQ